MSQITDPIETAMAVDWEQWRRTFDLHPDELWNVPSVFPEVLQSPRAFVTPEVLQAILEPEQGSREDFFRHYLEAGELAAASILVSSPDTPERERRVMQQALGSRRGELDVEYAEAQAAMDSAHQRLVSLGKRPSTDPDVLGVVDSAKTLRDVSRIGPAVRILREKAFVLEEELGAVHAETIRDIQRLRAEAVALPESNVQMAVRRQLELAEQYERDEFNDLAASAVRIAREMLETGSTAGLADEGVIDYQLRGPFPSQLRASDIVSWVLRQERPRSVRVSDWERWVAEWLPPEWGQNSDPEDAVFAAINALAGASRPHTPTSRNSTWGDFLKVFFQLIGREGDGPKYTELLPLESIMGRATGRSHVGFWLGSCRPTFQIKGSVFEEELGFGLPVVIWHRPKDRYSPPAATLETQLNKKRLTQSRVLVLADEPMTREDIRPLQQRLPTASVLDETALLRIILSPSPFLPEANREKIRRLHFTTAITAQLPEEMASPFKESGPRTSGMFFGREDELRRLSDPGGPTILHGGRKLGKSSILLELQRLFVNRDPEHNVAVYVDCFRAGRSAESVRQLAQDIAIKLREYRPETATGQRSAPFRQEMIMPKGVRDFIENLKGVLRKFPEHRILLLLDEADNLCSYLSVLNSQDALDEQLLGWELRSLVIDPEFSGRFDVRFAGFQEIQRTTSDSNGPFYNFRSGAMALTVFERSEAQDMLLTTLGGLGVQFESPALLEQVLEFSGRHPAILQECGQRLYHMVRARRTLGPWVLRREDIRNLLLDSTLRKSIVKTIHLNVTRPTKAQKALALLLYLWVQQIMSPANDMVPREAMSAQDLHALIGSVLGSEAQQKLGATDIEIYLGDLVVLGVLVTRPARRYVFAHRALATLLYHDYFAGGLNRQTVIDAWLEYEQEISSSPRVVLPRQDGRMHTLSPLPREAHDRLLRGLDLGPVVLLGPRGSGLTLVSDWVGRQCPTASSGTDGKEPPKMPRVQPEEPTGTALREELARALEIEPGSNWRELWTSAKEAVQRLANNSEVVTVLIDSLDALAASENMPLFLWEESDYPDFFAFVAALTRMARGHVRFLATGSLETARFWATDAADLEMQPILARTERLTSSELSLWLDTAHVVMSDAAAKNAIWRVTGGDWRLLNALHSWIEQTRKDQNHPFDDPIDEAEVQRFAAMIMAPELRAVQAPDLHGRVTDPALEPLRVLLRAGKELDVGEENTTDNWVAACRLYSEETRGVDWSREAWRRELQALTILREIEETQPASADGTSGRIRVAPDDPWLRLLQA